MPKKKTAETTESDFALLCDEILGEFIAARGIVPELCGVRWHTALGKLRYCAGLEKPAFNRALFAHLRDRCEYSTDEDVAAAFHFPDEMLPTFEDQAARAEAAKKRAEAERLEAEADAQESELRARDQRILEIRERLPFMREQFAYYRDVLPGELRGAIESAKRAAAARGYSLRPHANVGNPVTFIVAQDADALAAERSLAEHPARLAAAEKQITDLEAELELLEPKRRKRKTA